MRSRGDGVWGGGWLLRPQHVRREALRRPGKSCYTPGSRDTMYGVDPVATCRPTKSQCPVRMCCWCGLITMSEWTSTRPWGMLQMMWSQWWWLPWHEMVVVLQGVYTFTTRDDAKVWSEWLLPWWTCPAVGGRVRWHHWEEAPGSRQWTTQQVLPCRRELTKHCRFTFHNSVPLYLISKVQFTQKIRGVWDHILLSFLFPRLTQWPRQSHRGMDF